MTKMQNEIEELLLLKIIEGRADESEINLFNKWIESSAENAVLFNQLKMSYKLSSFGSHSTKANWEKVVNKVRTGYTVPDFIELPENSGAISKIWHSPFLRVAATIVLLIGISFLLKVTVFSSEQLIVSGKDLMKNEPYLMSDGSLVFLNGDSEIAIPNKFGEKSRDVSLSGEAYFEIEHSEGIPFVVKTHSTTTRVLGTSFNVYSDQSGQVKVSVTSGLVEFAQNEKVETIRLKAGEQGEYDPRSKGVEKSIISNPNFQAWRTGVFIFDETPLGEALHLLGDYYSHIFMLNGVTERIGNITTTFDNQPLEAVLEELTLLMNAKIEIKNDTIIFNPNI
jgi:transmembrane sensor